MQYENIPTLRLLIIAEILGLIATELRLTMVTERCMQRCALLRISCTKYSSHSETHSISQHFLTSAFPLEPGDISCYEIGRVATV